MKYATPAAGNGPLDGVYRCPQAFPTQPVPDHCDHGYEFINGTWQKGAALLASEKDESDDVIERSALRSAIATFKAGTATMAQVQRAIAYLLKKTL